jgi:hypothetical protein
VPDRALGDVAGGKADVDVTGDAVGVGIEPADSDSLPAATRGRVDEEVAAVEDGLEVQGAPRVALLPVILAKPGQVGVHPALPKLVQ